MEPYIKGNINDITYMSELIPPSCFRLSADRQARKQGGLIRPSLRSRTRLDDPEQDSSFHSELS